MSDARQSLQQELEIAVVDVLEQDYDLEVRLPKDDWNRRRRRVATLHFDYRWDAQPTHARVVVTIEGLESRAHVLHADFSTAESIERSAEDCESLALSVYTFLQEGRESDATVEHPALGGVTRRWDD